MSQVVLDGTCNTVSTDVDVQGAGGFNLGAAVWGATATRVSNVVKPTLASDFTFEAAVSAGAVTFKVVKQPLATSPTFGSPTATLTLNAGTDTELKSCNVPTDATNDSVVIQGVSGGAGATVATYRAFFSAPIPAGSGNRQAMEGWNNLPPAGGHGTYAAV